MVFFFRLCFFVMTVFTIIFLYLVCFFSWLCTQSQQTGFPSRFKKANKQKIITSPATVKFIYTREKRTLFNELDPLPVCFSHPAGKRYTLTAVQSCSHTTKRAKRGTKLFTSDRTYREHKALSGTG